jgi:adenosylcobinamide-phosphate guanylyltransferase
MRKFPVSVIKTPGKEYVSDMGYAIRNLQLRTVLAIGADLPLVTPEVIDTIIECYEQCGKSALSVVVPMETKAQLGLAGKYGFKLNGKIVVPAGINLIDGCKIDEEEIDEKIYVLDRKEVALNINTVQELQIAENLFKKYSNKKVHGHIR